MTGSIEPIPDRDLAWSPDDPRVQRWGHWRDLTPDERQDAITRTILTMWQEAAACCVGLPMNRGSIEDDAKVSAPLDDRPYPDPSA